MFLKKVMWLNLEQIIVISLIQTKNIHRDLWTIRENLSIVIVINQALGALCSPNGTLKNPKNNPCSFRQQRPDMAFPASKHKTPLVCLNSGLTWQYYSNKKTKTAPLFTCMKWFRGKGDIICTNANSLSSEEESEVK